MEEIVLIGGGGHCRSVIDVVEQENRFHIAGIIDPDRLVGTTILGYEMIGGDSLLEELAGRVRNALVTVGQIQSPDVRIKLFRLAKQAGFILPAVFSPRAYVSKHAKIGEGSIIMHDALVNCGVKIGKNCIINTKSLLEHDSLVGDHCHISTGAIINGGGKVAAKSFVGSNVTSREYSIIEGNSFIKAGSLVK